MPQLTALAGIRKNHKNRTVRAKSTTTRVLKLCKVLNDMQISGGTNSGILRSSAQCVSHVEQAEEGVRRKFSRRSLSATGSPVLFFRGSRRTSSSSRIAPCSPYGGLCCRLRLDPRVTRKLTASGLSCHWNSFVFLFRWQTWLISYLHFEHLVLTKRIP